MSMTAEWIAIGLLALLVFIFALDLAGNRKRVPRPKPVPQKKPEPQPGAEPVAPQAEAPTKKEEAAEPAVAEPAESAAPQPEAPVPEQAPEPVAEEPAVSVFERIRKGLGKTRATLSSGLSDLFAVGKKIDEDLLEEIETTLLMADVGVTATSEIIESLTDKLERNQLKRPKSG